MQITLVRKKILPENLQRQLLLNEHLLAGLFVEVIHASAQLFFDVLPTR
jgi:hypothetical protein